MKLKNWTVSAVMTAALAVAWPAGLRAEPVVKEGTVSVAVGEVHPKAAGGVVVEFNNSAEAGMLRRAYKILATGDHDYDGHRVKAMHAVEAAAKGLGFDLWGDDHDRTTQALSDDRLVEAKGLIAQARGAASLKGQKKVDRHLNEAIRQLNVALNIR